MPDAFSPSHNLFLCFCFFPIVEFFASSSSGTQHFQGLEDEEEEEEEDGQPGGEEEGQGGGASEDDLHDEEDDEGDGQNGIEQRDQKVCHVMSCYSHLRM